MLLFYNHSTIVSVARTANYFYSVDTYDGQPSYF